MGLFLQIYLSRCAVDPTSGLYVPGNQVNKEMEDIGINKRKYIVKFT